MLTSNDSKDIFKQGSAAAWPICLGYVPIGLAFGVLAQQAGVPWWAVGMMSVLVFAGSAQFICVAMITAGASSLAMIAATFIINLRHLLMSSALAVYLQGVNRGFLAFFSYGITDESFATNMAHFRKGPWDKLAALTVNQLANFVWIVSTICGALMGQLVPKGALGIDYALTGMFICLLVLQTHGWIYVLTGIFAAIVSMSWFLLVPGDSYIIGAALCSTTLGYFLKQLHKRRQ